MGVAITVQTLGAIMQKIFRYRLKMVREKSVKYDLMTGSDDAKKKCLFFFKQLLDSPTESLGVIVMDVKNLPIGHYIASEGTPDASLVDPRNVFSIAMQLMATTIILCHNHPSGDLSPSPEDFAVTKRMMEAGSILNIRVLDHIVIGRNPDNLQANSVSIMEMGLM
jgi:DNA repair protein RadC